MNHDVVPLTQHGEEPIALKEWASAVEALLNGQLIIVMRKGGIAEETKHFQLVSRRFYLLPAYEHQREELVKPEYRHLVQETKAGWSAEADSVTISGFAEAVDDIEIRDQETLDKLRDLHIWTDSFAEERLKWKKTQPLHLLVLRVYRLDKPAQLPLRTAYTGCKSWVRLEDEVSASAAEPVLDEQTFCQHLDKIRQSLR